MTGRGLPPGKRKQRSRVYEDALKSSPLVGAPSLDGVGRGRLKEVERISAEGCLSTGFR